MRLTHLQSGLLINPAGFADLRQSLLIAVLIGAQLRLVQGTLNYALSLIGEPTGLHH